MFKKLAFFLIMLFSLAFSILNAQSAKNSAYKSRVDSVYTATKGKGWVLTSYFLTTKQTDKKQSFKDYTFRFNNSDSSMFHVESTGSNNKIGYLRASNKYGTFNFFIPIVSEDSAYYTANDELYNQTVQLLNTGQFKLVDLKPSKIKFRSMDPSQGELFIEFTKKD